MYLDGGEVRPSFRRLARDGVKGFWALGDQQVFYSQNGIDWTDFSLNLREQGSFTAYSVLNALGNVFLFCRNRHGVFAYTLHNREWVPNSEIEVDSSLVACSVSDELYISGSLDSCAFVSRSTDGAQSWRKTILDGEGVPVSITMSSLNAGTCCLWQSYDGPELRLDDRSSLYFTSDSGANWREVATASTMVLGVAAAKQDGLLLGGSNGQLLLFDLRMGIRTIRFNQSDVVAVDVFEDAYLAVTETQESPGTHSILFSRDGMKWSEEELDFQGRINGAILLSPLDAVISTTTSLYHCSRLSP